MGKRLWKDRAAMLDDFALFDEEEAERMKPTADDGSTVTEADLDEIIAAARERAAVLKDLRAALVARDVTEALRLARKATGLPESVE